MEKRQFVSPASRNEDIDDLSFAKIHRRSAMTMDYVSRTVRYDDGFRYESTSKSRGLLDAIYQFSLTPSSFVLKEMSWRAHYHSSSSEETRPVQVRGDFFLYFDCSRYTKFLINFSWFVTRAALGMVFPCFWQVFKGKLCQGLPWFCYLLQNKSNGYLQRDS